MNNCKNPLKLTYSRQLFVGYKVSKPNDQTGEYVDKKVADELLSACEWAKEQFKKLADEGRYPEFMLSQNGGEGIMPIVNAIKLATEQS
jgi:hypothetical protein